MNDKGRLSAVVTTFRPDRGFVSRFAPLLDLCEQIVVVDNTPGGSAFHDLPARFHLIQDGVNRGLGPALNQGILRAKDSGADHVILFDQDSSPRTQSVAQLLSLCRAAQQRLGDRCAVGPTHVDDVTGSASRPRGQKRAMSDLDDVTCLPTSGLLFPLREIGADTLFASDLFLDLVDFEWCWRQRRTGWRFLRAPDAVLVHRFGVEERRCAGWRFHVPAPYRHYFQFRDTLRLVWRPYVPTYSRWRLTCTLPIKLLVYPVILDHGAERLRWMLRGMRDALRGVTGIGAASGALGR
jgi:rhamnosyltransferase